MADLLDYLDWRGDVPFSVDPFNEVDNLVLSELAYVDFGGIVPGPDELMRAALKVPSAGSLTAPAGTDGSLTVPTETAGLRAASAGADEPMSTAAETAAPWVTIEEAARAFWQIHTEAEIENSSTLFRRAPLLLDKLCSGARFGTMRLTGYVNRISAVKDEQMSAMTCLLEDGTAFVAFRGTDDTIVGWKEDFSFSFRRETGGQKSAADYLSCLFGDGDRRGMLNGQESAPREGKPAAEQWRTEKQRTCGPDLFGVETGMEEGKPVAKQRKTGSRDLFGVETGMEEGFPLRVGGHSKGGNFAVYAAAFCQPCVRARIRDVYTNDGPGFLAEITDTPEYREILPRVHSIVPEESVFGLLLDNSYYHKVVKSSGRGIWQHDPLSWQVRRNRFEEAARLSERSAVLEKAMESWLSAMSLEERKEFVDTLFSLFSDTGIENVSEITADQFRSIPELFRSYWEMDTEERHLLAETAGRLLKSGADTLTEELQTRLGRLLDQRKTETKYGTSKAPESRASEAKTCLREEEGT